MHVANQLNQGLFEIEVAGSAASSEDVFPEWSQYDRIGIAVSEPFGSLGASLLMQLATTLFYDARPSRRDQAPQYPQIYLFHVRRLHGDHSNFDFWPERHEVRVDSGYDLLGAINDRAITRLLLPHSDSASLDYIYAHPSGWTDRYAAEDRLRSVLTYSPSGQVDGGDVVIRSDDAELEKMTTWTLDVEGTKDYFDARSDQELLDMEIGPSSVSDLRRWSDIAFGRKDECGRDERLLLAAERARVSPGSTRTQSYQRITTDQALRIIGQFDRSEL
ncbi:hypothetical protein GDN83_21360 [Gordonia jinghuaiqii]|uniref:Uncharacterized protein n=1 Tax=Gordonia jinghuaiqii TaxID=2758710 RepID=A0A7D7R3H6_9ACTN|nr:hypothetical protein [Gordonia jinghuaiqii]MCR5980256.1 hypothetical protein [Gordonia jinghuaiqii]QMT01992.1 hypothetical protein H1R19_02025 [Gordonia jinghuaiqii]